MRCGGPSRRRQRKAREKEQRLGRHVLFPIGLVPLNEIRAWNLFDHDLGQDLAKEVRSYHIPDFSKWKTDHDAYTREFNRLIDALKTEK